ncbi:MAG: hypothetical protein PHX27_00450 [Candidatus ainarchaeum sp.]|nr:hypothetical protein [Candidatus ainarchaeum sp.]
MKKGFVSILVVLSVTIITILFIGINNNYSITDYSNQITNTKIILTNYEIILNQSIQDCNWQKSNPEIETCINQKATDLHTLIFDDTVLSCDKPNYILKDQNATGKLNCFSQIITNELEFSINLSKIITLKKY